MCPGLPRLKGRMRTTRRMATNQLPRAAALAILFGAAAPPAQASFMDTLGNLWSSGSQAVGNLWNSGRETVSGWFGGGDEASGGSTSGGAATGPSAGSGASSGAGASAPTSADLPALLEQTRRGQEEVLQRALLLEDFMSEVGPQGPGVASRPYIAERIRAFETSRDALDVLYGRVNTVLSQVPADALSSEVRQQVGEIQRKQQSLVASTQRMQQIYARWPAPTQTQVDQEVRQGVGATPAGASSASASTGAPSGEAPATDPRPAYAPDIQRTDQGEAGAPPPSPPADEPPAPPSEGAGLFGPRANDPAAEDPSQAPGPGEAGDGSPAAASGGEGDDRWAGLEPKKFTDSAEDMGLTDGSGSADTPASPSSASEGEMEAKTFTDSAEVAGGEAGGQGEAGDDARGGTTGAAGEAATTLSDSAEATPGEGAAASPGTSTLGERPALEPARKGDGPLDPDDPEVAALIDEWLSAMGLDEYGRWVSPSHIQANGAPETDGRSRTRYVLDHHRNNSEGGISLEDFLRQRLNGEAVGGPSAPARGGASVSAGRGSAAGSASVTQGSATRRSAYSATLGALEGGDRSAARQAYQAYRQ